MLFIHGTVEMEFGCRFLMIREAAWTILGTKEISSSFLLPPKPFLVRLAVGLSLEALIAPEMLATKIGDTASILESSLK